ncbi:MAG: imidazole glycerol phosphate synthase subunit HisH [Robiginitomaculum sp.]|nr:MAG: imidazole glycerol phosphate synthase subunit HisH [Robiginitomaculum sp.]
MAVAIVDTGCANLASVAFAFARLGVSNTVTQDAALIKSADHVILPGVGAMPFAMEQLRARGLVDVLRSLSQPLMGICLGMQMLFDGSEEGDVSGLGLIDGTVLQMNADAEPLPAPLPAPLPHMGWNTLENLADDPLLHGINTGDYVYFVHSFAASVGDKTLATTSYGQPFSAIIKQDNIYGCQFHPERSGQTGAKILANFLKVKP